MFEVILKKIQDFLNSENRNTYVTDNTLTLYIRKSKRIINGKLYSFFDLANFQVVENKQKREIFTNFLLALLKKYPNLNFFIESIINPKVIDIITPIGFKKVNNQEIYQIDYYRLGKND